MSEIIVKPEIEEIINNVLEDEILKIALNFIEYLKENKIKPRWSAENVWKISYKNYSVCFIRLYGASKYHNVKERSWHIIPFIGEYTDSTLSTELKEIAMANKHTCKICGRCALELNTLFGKKYDYICEKALIFNNPDEITIECVKKLIELRIQAIKDGEVKRHKYVAIRNR